MWLNGQIAEDQQDEGWWGLSGQGPMRWGLTKLDKL